MVSLLLAVIYLAFISLGLPDSLLGSAWPVMHVELGAPLSAMGAVTMIISAGTIVSSLASYCFWGVGAIISPFIMGACLTGESGWAGGYRVVSYIQFALVAVLFFSLPLWKKRPAQEIAAKSLTLPQTVKLKGVAFVLIAFFAYCALESTAMNWASSYLTEHHGVSAELAATFGSLFFWGITAGRFLSGFVSEKLGDRRLIRIGAGIIVVGIVLIAIPVNTEICALIGFVVVGLGCAPVYPSIIHATPANFGQEHSQAVIGVEMASAYVGTTFMPPLFGLIAQYADIGFLPLFLAIFLVLLFCMTELLNRTVKSVPAPLAEGEEKGEKK